MDIATVIEANHLIGRLNDAELALANLPSDETLMAYLKDNPEDLRLSVRFASKPEDVKRIMDENPGMPQDVAESYAQPTISCEVVEDVQGHMIATLRASLQTRINLLKLKIKALGVEVVSERRQEVPASMTGLVH